jgi:hypothetical protein
VAGREPKKSSSAASVALWKRGYACAYAGRFRRGGGLGLDPSWREAEVGSMALEVDASSG